MVLLQQQAPRRSSCGTTTEREKIVDISEHPLTNSELTDLAVKIVNRPLENIRNFVCVGYTTDNELLIVSADPHRKCIATLLGEAYLHATEDLPVLIEPSQEYTGADGKTVQFIPDEDTDEG